MGRGSFIPVYLKNVFKRCLNRGKLIDQCIGVLVILIRCNQDQLLLKVLYKLDNLFPQNRKNTYIVAFGLSLKSSVIRIDITISKSPSILSETEITLTFFCYC